MERYWIIVRRQDLELYRALSVAFRGQTGFRVLLDRRRVPAPRRGSAERREGPLRWGPDEFIVAERGDWSPVRHQRLPAPALETTA